MVHRSIIAPNSTSFYDRRMESTATPAAREPFADWSEDQRRELDSHTANPLVGTRLLLEDARVRVWEIRLPPGGRLAFHRHVLDYVWTCVSGGNAISRRLAFHRHVLDYVWTCVSGGNAISRDAAGNTNRVDYDVGETRALSFDTGASMIHDLENVGGAEIVFTTVEFLESANDPLPLAAGS
jgi:hypothetical protein